jgi:hypothetical protein
MKVLLTISLAIACTTALAAEKKKQEDKVTPVLAPDSKVTSIIRSLADGASANLPPIKTTGDINAVARKWKMDKNGPRGRNYCVKMMWMPERKRAIFCGANHGAPHRLNDVWEYDLAANTWVCLYGPDLSKGSKKLANWRDTSVVDGVLRTKRGGPAIIGHQWWQLDYDPELKAMLFLSSWPYAPKEVKAKMLPQNKHKPPLWAFYPEKKKWEPIMPKAESKKPRTGIAVYFQYVPALKKTAYVDAGWKAGGMWLYNSKDNSWEKTHGGEKFKAKNNPATPVADGVMVYAPEKKLLIACTRAGKSKKKTPGGRTVHYDVQKKTWEPAASGVDTPRGHTSFTPCGYDTVAKVMFLYHQGDKVFWGYDPEKKKWSKITPKGPAPMSGRGKVIGYYDEARNVFVLNQASKVWVYRHKRRKR